MIILVTKKFKISVFSCCANVRYYLFKMLQSFPTLKYYNNLEGVYCYCMSQHLITAFKNETNYQHDFEFIKPCKTCFNVTYFT